MQNHLPRAGRTSRGPGVMKSKEEDEASPFALSTGKILRDSGLRPRKGLGQHFLTDRSVPPRIVEAANLEPDNCVVEVGPAWGF